MDRKELLEHFERVGGLLTLGTSWPPTRRALINAILEREEENRQHYLSKAEEYPLRRPGEGWENSDEFTRRKDQRVFLSWEKDPFSAATALVTDSEEHIWNIPDGIRADDVILTVLGTKIPLVVRLEVVNDVEDRLLGTEKIALFSNPIALSHLEEHTGLSIAPRAQELASDDADKILAALIELTEAPRPIFLRAGDCTIDQTEGTGILLAVISLLQRDVYEDLHCGACDRPDPESLHPHIFRPNPERLELEIQDHVDDTTLLCHDCHVVLHRPTLQQFKGVVASPPCPHCGARNPRTILWGEPAGIPDDDHVAYGCLMPFEPPPQWECRKCQKSFSAISDPQAFMFMPQDQQ